MSNNVQCNIRIPADLRERILLSAQQEGRSFTNEVIQRLNLTYADRENKSDYLELTAAMVFACFMANDQLLDSFTKAAKQFGEEDGFRMAAATAASLADTLTREVALRALASGRQA